jgi:hypothetical protein
MRQEDVVAGLLRKGFREETGRDHYFYFYVTLNGKKSIIRTKTSLGRGIVLGDDLIHKMSQQCKLTKKKFLALVECTLSQAQYEAELKASGIRIG